MGIKGAQLRAKAVVPALVAMVLGAVMAAGGGLAASAAPPYQTEADITSLAFTDTTVESGSAAQLQGSWSLPENPATPAGFVMDLPDKLKGRTDSFALTDPTGSTMGHCTVTADQLYCDIDDAYVAAHPLELHGTFNFWVTVQTQVDHATETTYDIDGHATTITVTPKPGTCTAGCDFHGRGSYKTGKYDDANQAVDWTVAVAAGVNGMADGQAVTVDDVPGPNQTLVTQIGATTYPYVLTTNQVTLHADGTYAPGNWQVMDPGSYTVVSPGKVTFTSKGGYFYNVHFATKPTDLDQPGTHTYTNDATVTVGSKSTHVGAQVVHQGGGGTGGGTEVGRFSIAKHVEWDGTPVAGLTYSGTYTVTLPGGAVRTGTYQVADGATWTSPSFATGSTVHLTEDTPNGPDGVEWAAPDFSQNDFAIAGGTTTLDTLTNHATVLPTPTPTPTDTPTVTPTPTLSPTVDAQFPELPTTPPTATGGLATTGGTVAAWMVPIGLLLVVGGAALLGARTRRS